MGIWTTTPRTWVAGEVPTATHFNENLRDFGRAFSDAWTSYTPTLTASTTNPTNWTQTGYYMRAGKLVICRFLLVAGASMTAGSGTYRIALPVAAATTTSFVQLGVALCFDSSAGAMLKPNCDLDTSVSYFTLAYPATWPSGTLTRVTNTAPWTWATNDLIQATLVYEAA